MGEEFPFSPSCAASFSVVKRANIEAIVFLGDDTITIHAYSAPLFLRHMNRIFEKMAARSSKGCRGRWKNKFITSYFSPGMFFSLQINKQNTLLKVVSQSLNIINMNILWSSQFLHKSCMLQIRQNRLLSENTAQ